MCNDWINERLKKDPQMLDAFINEIPKEFNIKDDDLLMLSRCFKRVVEIKGWEFLDKKLLNLTENENRKHKLIKTKR